MWRGWLYVATTALLVGCGSSSSSTTAGESPGATSDPASYGVDVVDWPNTLAQAQPLLKALPASLSGRTRHADGGFAVYDDEYAMVQVQDVGRNARMMSAPEDPPALLATFASMWMCDRASLAGTAPFRGTVAADVPNDVWFSCHVSKDGDQPEAQVVGWTSGDVIWFAQAPTTALVQALLNPLMTAASALPGDGPGSRPTVATATAPYRIEEVPWPQTLQGAARLGARLDALEGPHARGQGASLMAEYPSGDVFMVSSREKGMDSAMMLAASFGLMYSCGRGSFEGTAAVIEGATGVSRPPPETDVRWFTCDVKGAEGDPSFRGHAVGWTSGPLAWLLIGSNETRAEMLMTALADAAAG